MHVIGAGNANRSGVYTESRKILGDELIRLATDSVTVCFPPARLAGMLEHHASNEASLSQPVPRAMMKITSRYH